MSARAPCVKLYCFVSDFIVLCPTLLFVHNNCERTIMFDTSSPMKVGDFDMQRVKTMFDTSTGRSLPSSKFATINFDTTPRAFRSHVTGCYRPEADLDAIKSPHPTLTGHER